MTIDSILYCTVELDHDPIIMQATDYCMKLLSVTIRYTLSRFKLTFRPFWRGGTREIESLFLLTPLYSKW